MSFTATWPTYDGNPDGGVRMTVTTTDEVGALVELLSEEDSGVATIEHQGRERSDFMGESLPDHILSAGVWHGYGYLEHVDSDHDLAQSVGDPGSPVYHSDQNEFAAGTGVPLDVLAKALEEFLVTAHRPTSVEWRS